MFDRILLIDDDPSTNFYHKIVLRDYGNVKDSVECFGVDEAIAYLKTTQSTPSIIFLDINMPIKSGWDFLDEYTQLSEDKKARALYILSTSKMQEDIDKAENHPLVDGYYTKPLSIDIVTELKEIFGSEAE